MNYAQRIAIVQQLVFATVNSVGWISDGSSSKTHDDGVCVGLELSNRGLMVLVRRDSGKIVLVSWRMRQTDANAIIDAYATTAIHRITQSRIVGILHVYAEPMKIVASDRVRHTLYVADWTLRRERGTRYAANCESSYNRQGV